MPQHVHIVNINVAGFSVMMNFLGVGLLIVALPYKSFEMRQKKEECAASNPLKPLQDKYAQVNNTVPSIVHRIIFSRDVRWNSGKYLTCMKYDSLKNLKVTS